MGPAARGDGPRRHPHGTHDPVWPVNGEDATIPSVRQNSVQAFARDNPVLPTETRSRPVPVSHREPVLPGRRPHVARLGVGPASGHSNPHPAVITTLNEALHPLSSNLLETKSPRDEQDVQPPGPRPAARGSLEAPTQKPRLRARPGATGPWCGGRVRGRLGERGRVAVHFRAARGTTVAGEVRAGVSEAAWGY